MEFEIGEVVDYKGDAAPHGKYRITKKIKDYSNRWPRMHRGLLVEIAPRGGPYRGFVSSRPSDYEWWIEADRCDSFRYLARRAIAK